MAAPLDASAYHPGQFVRFARRPYVLLQRVGLAGWIGRALDDPDAAPRILLPYDMKPAPKRLARAERRTARADRQSHDQAHRIA